MPDLSVLEEGWGAIREDTIRPVAEGVWFAWRERERTTLDIVNGLYWLDDGSKVVSLARGTDLHAWGTVDYETYVFRPEGVDIDVCCHGSEEEAEKCALTFFATGEWCRGSFDDE